VRRGVVLGSLLALVLVLPASARQQAGETVTVKVGQTVPLKTVFDKKTTYTVVVSGQVTMRLNDGSGTPTYYDPFHGAQGPNCEKSGVGVYLQIKDPRGDTINASDAYRPPVYTIPCRRDHRYTFQLNDAYPPSWDIHGKAKAYIPLQPDPAYWTASGSFKLTIEAEPPEPVATIIWGVHARKKKGVLAQAHLNGRGLMETLEIKEGNFADTARLLPVTALNGGFPHVEYEYEGVRSRRVDMVITSGDLYMQGDPGRENERLSVRLAVEVAESNLDGCPERTKTRRGARGILTLVYYPRGAPDAIVSTFLRLPCGVDESWTDEQSDATIRVERVKKKR
jgi:hypothetical protein